MEIQYEFGYFGLVVVVEMFVVCDVFQGEVGVLEVVDQVVGDGLVGVVFQVGEFMQVEVWVVGQVVVLVQQVGQFFWCFVQDEEGVYQWVVEVQQVFYCVEYCCGWCVDQLLVVFVELLMWQVEMVEIYCWVFLGVVFSVLW